MPPALRPGHDESLTGGVGEPWWAKDAIAYLADRLDPSWHGLEWGAGSSTPWLAARLARLVTVESSFVWALCVQQAMTDDHWGLLPGWWLCCLPPFPSPSWLDPADSACLNHEGLDYRAYCGFPAYGLWSHVFDFVAIDGRARNGCLVQSKLILKKGGLLLLDNSDRTEYDLGVVPPAWERRDFHNGVWQTTIWRTPSG